MTSHEPPDTSQYCNYATESCARIGEGLFRFSTQNTELRYEILSPLSAIGPLANLETRVASEGFLPIS